MILQEVELVAFMTKVMRWEERDFYFITYSKLHYLRKCGTDIRIDI